MLRVPPTVSRRLLSSSSAATPRMHKAKDAWEAMKAARPHDDHPHVRIELDSIPLIRLE
jgi:hypothetical protein